MVTTPTGTLMEDFLRSEKTTVKDLIPEPLFNLLQPLLEE